MHLFSGTFAKRKCHVSQSVEVIKFPLTRSLARPPTHPQVCKKYRISLDPNTTRSPYKYTGNLLYIQNTVVYILISPTRKCVNLNNTLLQLNLYTQLQLSMYTTTSVKHVQLDNNKTCIPQPHVISTYTNYMRTIIYNHCKTVYSNYSNT